MNGGIFYWIFAALSNLMETLEAQGQSAKLSLFQRLWWLLDSATEYIRRTCLTPVLGPKYGIFPQT